MTTKHQIPSVAHPFVAARFPGFCGFAIGIIFSACGSAMGYRFGQFFVPMESPHSDPALVMLLGLVIPWLVFLGSFLIGLLFMRFYRRGLHKYHDLLVSRLLLAKGERQSLPLLQQLMIEWPLLALGLILVGVSFYGDSAQGAAWSMSCFGGLLASVSTTYAERSRIYDDAVNASGEAIADGSSPSSVRNLPVRARALLVFLATLLCGFSVFFAWQSGRIVVLIAESLNLTQPQ